MNSSADNAPITVAELETLLGPELAAIESSVRSKVSLGLLGRQKSVADSTTKILVSDERGRGLAVVICARPIAPDLVARGTSVAESIRKIVGDPLGDAIIRPIGSGYVDGRSYVILPCCREFSDIRAIRILQTLGIRSRLVHWLLEANAAAAQFHSQRPDAAANYHAALSHLQQLEMPDPGISRAIDEALRRLESGVWKPVHTFDHNDLWMGNVMLPPRSNPLFNSGSPFVLIDWAGANADGYGMYDLVRLARALKMSPSTLRNQLAAHCAVLGAELVDAPGHLLASLGQLHINLEHFPEHKYMNVLQDCWDVISPATANAS